MLSVKLIGQIAEKIVIQLLGKTKQLVGIHTFLFQYAVQVASVNFHTESEFLFSNSMTIYLNVNHFADMDKLTL